MVAFPRSGGDSGGDFRPLVHENTRYDISAGLENRKVASDPTQDRLSRTAKLSAQPDPRKTGVAKRSKDPLRGSAEVGGAGGDGEEVRPCEWGTGEVVMGR